MSTKLGMGSISVTELAAMIGVTPVYYGNDKQIELTGVGTDSRTVAEGDIFVAIPAPLSVYKTAEFVSIKHQLRFCYFYYTTGIVSFTES